MEVKMYKPLSWNLLPEDYAINGLSRPLRWGQKVGIMTAKILNWYLKAREEIKKIKRINCGRNKFQHQYFPIINSYLTMSKKFTKVLFRIDSPYSSMG